MHIVLAIDGSPSSLAARDLVAALRWPEGSTITVVGAFEIPVSWVDGTMVTADSITQVEDDLEAQVRDHLTDAARPLTERGWTVEQRVVRGRSADAIRSTGEQVGADLIVLGSRGHGPIGSMLLGSVSAEVADRATCSVLVARHDRVSRVLVATDGSESARAIPEVLASWQGLRDLPATVLSVAHLDEPTYGMLVPPLGSLDGEELVRRREEHMTWTHDHAEQMARALASAGLDATTEVRTGDPAHEIVSAASERGADLVITGSRGLRGLDRVLLGSVARNVLLHTDASVLIVRAPRLFGEGS